MTAKEMFEKLGYKEIDMKPYYVKYYEMVFGEKGSETKKQIKFSCDGQKGVEIWRGTHFKDYSSVFATTDASFVNLGEIKAINKQLEELGWNNE